MTTKLENQTHSLSEGEDKIVHTTTFADDAPAETVAPSTFVDDALFSNIDFSGVTDLKSLIERPVRLQSGLFSASDSTRLYNADPFIALMSTWSTKLDRAQMIRADVEVTLQVNAMRFQAGRYILAFLCSFGQQSNSTNFAEYDKMHASTLTQLTQLPHVEIDLAYETSVTMTIPWESVIAAWPNQSVITSSPGFGKLILFPYYPLVPESTATTAGYTLYARFVNATIAQPTVAQSGLERFVEQSGTEREQKANSIGPVSGFFNRVSKSTKILSEIPIVGPYMSQASWASSLLSRAASAMGWSKPPILNAPTYVQTRKMAYLEVADGASTARPLGGFSTNAVVPVGIGNVPDRDEMDFACLLSRYAYIQQSTWTTAQTSGTTVMSILIKPTGFWTTYALASILPPAVFPTLFFAKYRGSFKFRFKLVKNEFYSGRIGVYFQPYENGGVQFTTTSDLGLAYNRVIIDVRDTREFEIIAPYSSTYAFRDTTEVYGSLVVFVVDPLVCPDNMPGTVPLLVEVAGCDDLEYADYHFYGYGPAAPFVAQAGLERQVYVLGKEPVPGLSADKVAAGERFTSLRQLAKMFCWRAIAWTFDASKVHAINPFAVFYASQPTSIGTTYTGPSVNADLAGLIMACFGVHLGSMRVQWFPTLSTGQDSTYNYGTADLTPGFSQFTAADFYWIRGVLNTADENLDVIVPAFTKTAGRNLAGNLCNMNATVPVQPTGIGSSSRNVIWRLWSGASPTSLNSMRQFSDDANCTSFVSIPCVVKF